jgi:hypothetical protein
MSSPTTSIILRILDAAAHLVESGCASNRLLALINGNDKQQLEEEVSSIPMVHDVSASVPVGEYIINGSGFRVRVVYDRFVPSDQLWVVTEPESVTDILPLLYNNERIRENTL